MSTEDHKAIGYGYPLSQLHKVSKRALSESGESKEKVEKKKGKWINVIKMMSQGVLSIGSRKPLDGVPEWVTLEVLTGGFASGNYLAGGPLLNHETELLEKLSNNKSVPERLFLNMYYLSSEGLDELRQLLKSGEYEITIPEEAALLTIAWLIDNKHSTKAQALIDEISPWFSLLRFYPQESKSKVNEGEFSLQDVDSTIKELNTVDTSHSVKVQYETIKIWNPFYDKLVSLFLEIVDKKDLKELLKNEGYDKELVAIEDSNEELSGEWLAKASNLLAEYSKLRVKHNLSSKPDRKREYLYKLRTFLSKAVDEKELSPKETESIKQILAKYIAKRGEPFTEGHKIIRDAQYLQVNKITNKESASKLIELLTEYKDEKGLTKQELDDTLASYDESTHDKSLIPNYFQRKIKKTMIGNLPKLLEEEIITSSELFGKYLPEYTSLVVRKAFSDKSIEQLYAKTYKSFRSRRSLLLLNLEKQVQISELPWVRVITMLAKDNDLDAKSISHSSIIDILKMSFSFFPNTILPNKTIRELSSLVKAADLSIPLVEELAVDIFMGRFSEKYAESVRETSKLLKDSIYSFYYNIDYSRLYDVGSDELSKQCAERADLFGLTKDTSWIIKNGMIIEQQQILTTHNLALLFDRFKLESHLDLPALSLETFKWICKRLKQLNSQNWHGNLVGVKNAAYAWRQMVFYLSQMESESRNVAMKDILAYYDQQTKRFRSRLEPAINGLQLSFEGKILTLEILKKNKSKIFVGWSSSHWMLKEFARKLRR